MLRRPWAMPAGTVACAIVPAAFGSRKVVASCSGSMGVAGSKRTFTMRRSWLGCWKRIAARPRLPPRRHSRDCSRRDRRRRHRRGWCRPRPKRRTNRPGYTSHASPTPSPSASVLVGIEGVSGQLSRPSRRSRRRRRRSAPAPRTVARTRDRRDSRRRSGRGSRVGSVVRIVIDVAALRRATGTPHCRQRGRPIQRRPVDPRRRSRPAPRASRSRCSRNSELVHDDVATEAVQIEVALSALRWQPFPQVAQLPSS